MAYLIGAPLARLAGVPVRIMSRRSRNLYQAKHPLLSLMEWRLHRSMQAVIGNSRAVTADLAAEGCGADQIHLIYNGIDVAAIDSAEARPRPADAALIFVIVANLIPYKGHADLLRALAANARTLPPGWRLHCIGRDDGSGVQLGRLAAALGIKENVEFLGARTDVAARIKTADIGILCSHEEGFSNAILECMAAGLPMVVTDVGGNAEAVIDGETGIVVAPSDIPALGTALRDLASAPEKRSRLGRKGRERVQDFYSLDRCISDYEALYFSFAGHKSMNGADGLPTLPTGTQ
jgi:glycosyltransferase involved in cell wall biosynthesis